MLRLLLLLALVLPLSAVPVGKSVSFSVELAEGTPPFTYQWYKDDAPIPGATSATMEIVDFEASSAGLYWVVVSNEAGSVISNKVSLAAVKVPSKATITVSIAVGAVNP